MRIDLTPDASDNTLINFAPGSPRAGVRIGRGFFIYPQPLPRIDLAQPQGGLLCDAPLKEHSDVQVP